MVESGQSLASSSGNTLPKRVFPPVLQASIDVKQDSYAMRRVCIIFNTMENLERIFMLYDIHSNWRDLDALYPFCIGFR